MVNNKLTFAIAGVLGVLSMGVTTQNVEAANWLMLQGTEKSGTVGRAKVWGFIQPEAQYLKGSTVPAGAFKGAPMQPNTLGPDRAGRATFSIRRARIGIRGQGFPLDNKVNYFLLSEFGHNGITGPGGGGGAAKLTDASITLNHLPFARLRIGQFKTPGAEEGLQAIHVFDYVNFTNVTDQLLMERFADGDGSVAGSVNAPNGGVGAFRDIGVQVFDTIKMKGLEISYAGMIGNGNGINRQDNNGKKDLYGYLAVEQVYDGKGGRRQGLKAFAWIHKGKRTLISDAAGEYDRDRSGAGITYKKGKISVAAEVILASGLIRNGTDGGAKPGSVNTNNVKGGLNYLTDDKANGYYVHAGYKVMKKLEIDIRYDMLNRATNVASKERTFSTATLGAQYFLNRKTRITFNYEVRSMLVSNPNAIGDISKRTAAEAIADAVDDRVSMQVLAIF